MIMRIIISIIINIIITEVEITQCYCQQSFICSVIFNDKPVEKVQQSMTSYTCQINFSVSDVPIALHTITTFA